MNISSDFAQMDAVNWKKYDPTIDSSEMYSGEAIYCPRLSPVSRVLMNNSEQYVV
jgi:hypothetical protein